MAGRVFQARGSPTTGTPNSSADITTNQLQSEQPNDQTVEPYGEVPDQRCGPTDHQPHQGKPTPMALRSRQRPLRPFNLQLIASCRQYLRPRRRQRLDRLALVSSQVLLRESPETIEHWAQSSQDGALKPARASEQGNGEHHSPVSQHSIWSQFKSHLLSCMSRAGTASTAGATIAEPKQGSGSEAFESDAIRSKSSETSPSRQKGRKSSQKEQKTATKIKH